MQALVLVRQALTSKLEFIPNRRVLLYSRAIHITVVGWGVGLW